MTEPTIDQYAEALVRRAVSTLIRPAEGECLLCFVARMLDEYDCDNTLRFARRYRDLCAPRATALEARLGRMGGYCDCEIFLNGMRLADQHLTRDETGEWRAPERMPECARVRRASTQPCGNWTRRRWYDRW